MSEALVEQGGTVVFGDLMFALGLPFAIRSWAAHQRLARLLLPILTQLPFRMVYPTGDKQEKTTPRWGRWYDWADILAGDFHLIRRYLPAAEDCPLKDRAIVTNTTTAEDVKELTRRGAYLLATSTPRFQGRSPGTNVMEGVLVALNDGRPLSGAEYGRMLERLEWTPTVEYLQGETRNPA